MGKCSVKPKIKRNGIVKRKSLLVSKKMAKIKESKMRLEFGLGNHIILKSTGIGKKKII